MITLRSEKGYALTHEELDGNFSEFDAIKHPIDGSQMFCPTGDLYIYDISYGTDKNYVLLGSDQSSSGIMGTSEILSPFKAIVDKSPILSYNGKITPSAFANFGLVDEQIIFVDGYDTQILDIVFPSQVDLIEVESDLTTLGVASVTTGYVYRGELLKDGGTISTGVNYVLYHSTDRFTSNGLITIPSTWNDLDPFGDGSQIHYFKFENNAIDQMGNANITGSIAFNNNALLGSSSLQLDGDALNLLVNNSNMLVNGGYSYTVGMNVSAGSSALNLLSPPNTFYSRSLLEIHSSSAWFTSLFFRTVNFYDWYSGYTKVIEDVMLSGGAVTSNWTRLCSDNNFCGGQNTPGYACGFNSISFNNGITNSWSGGWNHYGATNVITFGQPKTLEMHQSVEVPTDFKFDANTSGTGIANAEALFDELRIFNRPLKYSEGYMLSNLLGQTAPTIYSITADISAEGTMYGVVDNSAHKQLMSIEYKGVSYSFGTPTIDEVNKKITYANRIAFVTTDFKLKIERQNYGWAGQTIKVRGYKKV